MPCCGSSIVSSWKVAVICLVKDVILTDGSTKGDSMCGSLRGQGSPPEEWGDWARTRAQGPLPVCTSWGSKGCQGHSTELGESHSAGGIPQRWAAREAVIFLNLTALCNRIRHRLQKPSIFTLYFLLFTGYWKAKVVYTFKMHDECENVSKQRVKR